MTLKQILAEASQHFFLKNKENNRRYFILKQFAIRELKVPNRVLDEFVQSFITRLPSSQEENYFTFFIWYFLNYMQTENSPQRFTTEIYVDKIQPFIATEIQAVKLTVEGANVVIKKCDPSEASFWSVYIQIIDGSLICVADCINQDAAQNMELFIHEITRKIFKG